MSLFQDLEESVKRARGSAAMLFFAERARCLPGADAHNLGVAGRFSESGASVVRMYEGATVFVQTRRSASSEMDRMRQVKFPSTIRGGQ